MKQTYDFQGFTCFARPAWDSESKKPEGRGVEENKTEPAFTLVNNDFGRPMTVGVIVPFLGILLSQMIATSNMSFVFFML